MIKDDFENFFLASAGASAALIGLLFVAVSVAPEQVLGPKAVALHQLRATMALSAFASTLVLSLIALLPTAHIGWPATVIGGGGTVFVLGSLRHLDSVEDRRGRRHALVLLVIFLLAMVFLVVAGIQSIIDPHDTGPVSRVAIAAIALILLGIDRSWELVGGRTSGVTGLITKRISAHAEDPPPPGS